MTPLEDFEYLCCECGTTANRDFAPSPCEAHGVCADCAELNGPAECQVQHADELIREALRGWGTVA